MLIYLGTSFVLAQIMMLNERMPIFLSLYTEKLLINFLFKWFKEKHLYAIDELYSKRNVSYFE